MINIFFALFFVLLQVFLLVLILLRSKSKSNQSYCVKKETISFTKVSYPNFIKYMHSQGNKLNVQTSKLTKSNIEYKVPIVTFKKVMGYNYIGIYQASGSNYIYMDSESLRGYKIKGKQVELAQDVSSAEYEEIIKELSIYLMTETDYMQVTTGEL